MSQDCPKESRTGPAGQESNKQDYLTEKQLRPRKKTGPIIHSRNNLKNA